MVSSLRTSRCVRILTAALSLMLAVREASAFSSFSQAPLLRTSPAFTRTSSTLRQKSTVVWTASSSLDESAEKSISTTYQELAEQALESKKSALQNATFSSGPAPPLTVPRLPLPGFELESIGLRGRWEAVDGSFYLPVSRGVEPRGIVHFLGGAFIGAAPHLGYKYFLEALSDEGYAVVSTPYNLSFSYVDVSAGILARSGGALKKAEEDYGSLPLIGIGHSCGALLHTLIPSFFPSYKPAASVLISYNNKPAAESIPNFEDLVVPVSNALLDSSDTATRLRGNLETAITEARQQADAFAASALAPTAFERELLPISREGLKVVEQVPDLLNEIKEGKREYAPNTKEVGELLNDAYLVPASLIVQFQDDTLDESDKLAGILRAGEGKPEEEEGETEMAKAGRQITIEVVEGSHITPLTQDVFISTPFDSFDPLLPIRRFARQESLRQIEGLLSRLLPFLQKQTS